VHLQQESELFNFSQTGVVASIKVRAVYSKGAFMFRRYVS
jgi:hypothetical protein